jgi:hypothetical protein
MIIARIVTVAADPDVRVRNLLVESDALKGTFEEIGHDISHGDRRATRSQPAENINIRERAASAARCARSSLQRSGNPMQVVHGADFMHRGV